MSQGVRGRAPGDIPYLVTAHRKGASEATRLTATAPLTLTIGNPGEDSVLAIAGSLSPLVFVTKYTIGSAVATRTFTVDLATYDTHIIEWFIRNATASGVGIEGRPNGDSTTARYLRIVGRVFGTAANTINSANANDAQLATCLASKESRGRLIISKMPSGVLVVEAWSRRTGSLGASGAAQEWYTYEYTYTTDPFTTFDITLTGAANAIDAGSIFEQYYMNPA